MKSTRTLDQPLVCIQGASGAQGAQGVSRCGIEPREAGVEPLRDGNEVVEVHARSGNSLKVEMTRTPQGVLYRCERPFLRGIAPTVKAAKRAIAEFRREARGAGGHKPSLLNRVPG